MFKTLSQIRFCKEFLGRLFFCPAAYLDIREEQKNKLTTKFEAKDRICDNVLGIFAGRGALPQILIEECQRNNQKFFLFLLDGENYEIDYSAFNPLKIAYGEVEKFLEVTRKNNIQELVFAGAVTKPNFSSLKVDKKGALLLAKIVASKILGDDAVLRAVIKFLEKEGLKIVPLHQLFNGLVLKKGCVSKLQPTKNEMENIEIAIKAIKTMSVFDIGQSVVVAQRQIVAVEALEGTDNMIARCLDLKTEYTKNSILVKLRKSKQSTKADLPTIGVATVNNCYAVGIKGIAIEANSTLILEQKKVVDLVDELKMFLIAV